MGYTSWEKVRKLNQDQLGIDAPNEISLCNSSDEPSVKFIREMCEELRFDKSSEERINLRDFDGTSVRPGMIPYNMEKDIDRLCLENSVCRFLKSGSEQDAFDVYFCFVEMFVEVYSDFRINEKCVTGKISQMVNKFVKGLDKYYSDEMLRISYKRSVNLSDDRVAAHLFLKEWGMAAFLCDTEKLPVLRKLLNVFDNEPNAFSDIYSGIGFNDLYSFAVALNARHYYDGFEDEVSRKEMVDKYNELSLEYKISNIRQAKAFIGYLDKIGCFYTDSEIEKEPLCEFSSADMDIIGPLEHERWMSEKISMGWSCGISHKNKQERELTRTSHLFVPYDELSEYEQDKDVKPMICMLKLIRKYSKYRIYRK